MIHVATVQTVNGTRQITGKGEISDVDYSLFMEKFDFLNEISPVKIAYDIAIRNAREFAFFMREDQLKKRSIDEKKDLEIIAIDGNRLLFNMCSSFSTFVDYSKKAVSHKEKANEDFKMFLNHTFDTSLDYRFFYKLRNFCTHYSFPFTTIKASDPGIISLTCSKDHLLEYDGWGLVKNDIEKMPENVAVCSYVEQLLVIITSIMIQTHYYFAVEYFEANKAIAELAEEFEAPSPVFIEDITNKGGTIHPIPIENIASGIDVLKSHPYVNVTMVKHSSEMTINPEKMHVEK